MHLAILEPDSITANTKIMPNQSSVSVCSAHRCMRGGTFVIVQLFRIISAASMVHMLYTMQYLLQVLSEWLATAFCFVCAESDDVEEEWPQRKPLAGR